MRRKDEGVRLALLQCAGEIALKEGTEAINIRRIAAQAGIATGTVYNYFPGKEDLLLALTEEYWRKALMEMGGAIAAGPFDRQLEAMYVFLKQKVNEDAGVLMGSLRGAETAGRERMQTMQRVIKALLLARLKEDGGIDPAVWSDRFTMEQFTGFLMTNLVALLHGETREFEFFLEVVRRTLYRAKR